eukprot:Skav231709  [mRNA]  locus=scaffold1306:146797:149454:+ [translate_table: standard]
MNGLKNHIQNGRCTAFDLEAPSVAPPLDDQLELAFWSGQLVDILADPDVRVKLAHTCQFCERTYDRSGDLHVHLQQQHATLYHRGLTLQKHLLSRLYVDLGRLCAPTVTQETLSHVCPLFAQIAMMHAQSRLRLFEQPASALPPHGGILVPGYFTEDQVQTLLHATTPDEVRDALQTGLCGHQWTDLWQNRTVISHLRCTCLQCGTGPLSPGSLHNHLLEDHPEGMQGIKHMLQQLLDPMWHTASTSHTCDSCKLTYCLPDSLHIVSKCLAQEHFSHQCPVALQLARLLANHTHGTRLWPSTGGDGPPNARGVPGTDTIPEAVPGGQTRRQAPQGLNTNQGRRKSRRKATDAPAGPDQSGGDIPRTGLGKPETTGLLRFVSQPRGQRSIETDGDGCNRMEATNHPIDDSPQSPVCDLTGSPEAEDHGPTNPGTEEPVANHGAEEPDVERRVVPVPTMVPEGTGDAAGHEDPGHPVEGPGHHLDRNDGSCQLQRSDPALPRSGPLDRGVPAEALSDTMEAAADLEGQHPAWLPPSLEQQCLVEPCRPPIETSQSDDEWTGQAITTDGYGLPTPEQEPEPSSPQGEGQRTSQLMDAVARLGLKPDVQFPYANAAFKALCWAHLCSDVPLQTFWGSHEGNVVAWLLAALSCDTDFALLHQPWSEGFLISRGSEHRPANVAEFTQALWFWLHPSNQMAWESRQRGKEEPITFSLGQQPIALHPTKHDHSHYMLQTLMEQWSMQDNLDTALLHADPVICCHLDRHEDLWRVRKRLDGELLLNSPTQVPIHAADGTIVYQDYEPIACVLHTGTDGASHYQALLRITIEDRSHWLLCDESMPTMQCEHLSTDMQKSITLVWLCNVSSYTMPALQPRQTQSEADALVDMISRT